MKAGRIERIFHAPWSATKTIRRLGASIIKLAGGSAPAPASTAADFTPCAKRLNCVSSRAAHGSSQYVAPLRHDVSRAEAQRVLLEIVRSHGNARIVTEEVTEDAGFVHATFASTLGFADDVMFLHLADGGGVVDIKSAARLGHYDFGVNRRRVETLRGEFEAALAQS